MCARRPSIAEDHIPGAVSAPVLDDAERAERRHALQAGLAIRGEEARRGAGREERRAPRRDALRRTGPRAGGRSCTAGAAASARRAMAHILREVGWDAQTLARRLPRLPPVGRRPAAATLPSPLRVAGDPRPHRQRQEPPAAARCAAPAPRCSTSRTSPRIAARCSAIFPDRPQPSQKMFESLLLDELTALEPGAAGVRRRRIEEDRPAAGPGSADRARCAPRPACVLDAALELRVALLIDEYRHFVEDPAALEAQLDCLVGAARPRKDRALEVARGARRVARVRRAPA